MTPLISANSLAMTYIAGPLSPKIPALRDVSFEVNKGEIFGYLGCNGAGKTTVIKILVGLLHATKGTAEILGTSVKKHECRTNIGYMPENVYFYEYLSAVESLHFYGKLFSLDRSTRKKRVAELIELVGLGVASNRPLKTYSKGMRQRLGLAQALINDPALVILDEPLSGLDPTGRHELRTLIRNLKTSGKTVFFSSHILGDAESLCDRVGILSDGRMEKVGTLHEIIDESVRCIHIRLRVTSGNLPFAVKPINEHKDGDVLTLTLRDEKEVASVIETAIKNDAVILEVSPEVESLEDAFLRVGSKRVDEQEVKLGG